MWRGKNVVVLGGTGFLGSHLTLALRGEEAEVRTPSTRNGWDLRELMQAKGAVSGSDVTFNCAAHQGGLAYQSMAPERIITDNLLLQAAVMDAQRLTNKGPLVTVTASCGYPDGLELMREEDWDSGPVHRSVAIYGTVQRLKVQMTRAYWQAGVQRYVCPILSNLYGPGEYFSYERAHGLAAMLRRFLDAKRGHDGEVTVWGSGRAVREWTYVADAAAALLEVAERYRSPDPINIGVGEGISVADLAALIARVLRFHGRIRFDTSKPEGALRKVMSAQHARSMLAWRPRVPLEDGIERTAKYLVDHYEEAVAA